VTPDEMRQLLIEDASRHVEPPTLEHPRKKRGAKAAMPGSTPFLEALPDNDPQLVELAELVEDAKMWVNILETIPPGGLHRASHSGYRERLVELLRYARAYRRAAQQE
jgi:hypothetical protein